MRIILKDYLTQLKEKDELDFLLCDLMRQKGFVIDYIPKTGNRQYGVDIQAKSKSELYLFVVKQGNIDRTVWNGEVNAVRPSLDEIFDVSLRSLPSTERKNHIHIILATNGVKSEAIKQNWDGYVDQHRTWDGMPISIEFWGIDEITDQAQQYLFSEQLFPGEMQSALRKALYYIEESDYRNTYFEAIVDSYIGQLYSYKTKKATPNRTEEKALDRILSSLQLSIQMIAQYAADAGKTKLCIQIYEYTIIQYWRFLLESAHFEKAYYTKWLHQFLRYFFEWNLQYYNAIEPLCAEDAFPNYSNLVEQKLQLYEVLGFLSSFAYCCFFFNEGNQYCAIVDTIIQLLNNCPQIHYPPYDANIGQLSMLFRTLLLSDRRDDVKTIIKNTALSLEHWFKKYRKYPTPEDTFRDAINIELGNDHNTYETSGLWGYLLLWIALLNDEDTFNRIVPFLASDLKEVTKCVWFFRQNEEAQFYLPGAMNSAGECVAIRVKKDLLDYKVFHSEMEYLLKQFENEQLSFDSYGFPALEMIVCHYYGYIPRVKLETEHCK